MKELKHFGAQLTLLTQFCITSINAWIVFSVADGLFVKQFLCIVDLQTTSAFYIHFVVFCVCVCVCVFVVIDVLCVWTDQDFTSRGADLAVAAKRWGFRPFHLLGRGNIINCAAVDEAFLNFCGEVPLNSTLPAECLELEPFVGARCFTTESVGVTLLGFYCLIQAFLLGVFMKMDAGFEHPNEDRHHRQCACLPARIYRHRFSLLLMPVAIIPVLGIVLMWSSLAMDGCLFQSGPYMTFMLCLVWALLCLVGACAYEKERHAVLHKPPDQHEFRTVHEQEQRIDATELDLD
jgi:hypothetical protein